MGPALLITVTLAALAPLGAARAQVQALPACPGVEQPLFTTLPMEPEQFLAFRPLGWLSPPVHVFPAKHSNFALARPGEVPPRLPVRAPGEVWVTAIDATEYLGQNKTGYSVWFQPCRDFEAYFFHLSSLSERLVAESQGGQAQCQTYSPGGTAIRRCFVRTMIAVRAGEIVGVSGDAAGVDFGAIDYRVGPLAFADPTHYSRQLLYYVSPVPYFAPAPRAALEAKLRSWDGSAARTATPRVGEVAQDVAGTAQGNWFPPGQHWAMQPPPQEDAFLALVHDYIDPRQPIFSVGNAVSGVRPGLYSFAVQASGRINRDFSAMTADGAAYCYDRMTAGTTAGRVPLGAVDGVILLAMPDAATLVIERRGSARDTCGSLAAWTFTAAAARFVR